MSKLREHEGEAGAAPAVARSPREATLVHREDLTPSLAIFRFELGEGVPDFEAGQFITLGIPTQARTIWRAYSICSPPDVKDHVELYIRLVERPNPGRFTSRLWPMKLGDRVRWRKPRGAFKLVERRKDGSPDERRLALIGGGTGLAPFLAFVQHLERRGSTREVVLCHGASHVDELGYRAFLEDMDRRLPHFHYLATISRPAEERNAGWAGYTGRVETLMQRPADGGPSPLERALDAPLAPEDSCIYACGLHGTVDSVLECAGALGFRTHRNRRPDGSYDVFFEAYG